MKLACPPIGARSLRTQERDSTPRRADQGSKGPQNSKLNLRQDVSRVQVPPASFWFCFLRNTKRYCAATWPFPLQHAVWCFVPDRKMSFACCGASGSRVPCELEQHTRWTKCLAPRVSAKWFAVEWQWCMLARAQGWKILLLLFVLTSPMFAPRARQPARNGIRKRTELNTNIDTTPKQAKGREGKYKERANKFWRWCNRGRFKRIPENGAMPAINKNNKLIC